MAKAGITDKEVRALIVRAQHEGRTVTQADGSVPGLTATASKAGTLAWVLRYRTGGKQREATIGQYPAWGAADAREHAKELRRSVDKGVDVAAEKQIAKLAKETEWTVDELATCYFEKAEKELAPHTYKQRKRLFETYINPHIGAFPATSIKPQHIVQVVAKSLEGGKTLPKTVLIVMTQLFHHAVARAVVGLNPCRDVRETAVVGKSDPPKPRVKLMLKELSAFLPALASIPRQYELAIRILLLTAVRVGTLTEAKIEEFDLERATWSVPHSRRKNRRHTTGPFVIPLPPAAVEWVRELIVLADRSEYLLPVEARRHSDARNAMSKRTTVGDWLDRMPGCGHDWRRITPHDARATCRSWLTELKVPYEVRQRYLDHALRGMDVVYDKSDLIEQRREVADQWLGFMTKCEAGDEGAEILPLQRSA